MSCAQRSSRHDVASDRRCMSCAHHASLCGVDSDCRYMHLESLRSLSHAGHIHGTYCLSARVRKKSSATSFCIQVARLACLSGLCVAMQSIDCTNDYLRCKPLTVWIGADMKLWFLWIEDSGFPRNPAGTGRLPRQLDWQHLQMADGSTQWFWSYGDRVVLGDLAPPSTGSTHQWAQVNVKQWAPKHDDWVDAKEWKLVAGVDEQPR